MWNELRETVRGKWPNMDHSSTSNDIIYLTIHADAVYRTYAEGQDHEALFKKATQYMTVLRQKSPATEEQGKIVMKEINEMMVHAIFGSNSIERAGLGLDITLHLCHKVLSGEELPDIDERTTEYTSRLIEMQKIDKSLTNLPHAYILRGRREILQHMKAFQHMIHYFVTKREYMTEELIKTTHGILCCGVDILSDKFPPVASDQYAGKYRSVFVGAGSTMFSVPKFVPQKMADMCTQLKDEMIEAETKGSIDPFSLAAKYSLKFVEIHPFQDGNGRLCRMILNAIVFRFTGVFVAIGEREEDRTEYLDIKKRASRDMEGHGEYATFVLKKGVRSIHKMKQKLQGKRRHRIDEE